MPRFGPEPQERAEMVVKQLEQNIRDAKAKQPKRKKGVPEGMSFKKWQDLAKEEITQAILNAERKAVAERDAVDRFLTIAGTCFISMGFLGALFAVERIDKVVAAILVAIVGSVMILVGMEIPFRNVLEKHRRKSRNRKMAKINNLDRKVRDLEKYLKDKTDELKDDYNPYGWK